MRCIETQGRAIKISGLRMINYNMRCIETVTVICLVAETLDKLQHEMY